MISALNITADKMAECEPKRMTLKAPSCGYVAANAAEVHTEQIEGDAAQPAAKGVSGSVAPKGVQAADNHLEDLLRHIVRHVVMGGHAAQAGLAVPDHHRPDVLEQRFDRGGMPAHGLGGQLRDPQARLAGGAGASLRHEWMMPTGAGLIASRQQTAGSH